jgi:putative ABC transport system permease protein
MRAAPSGDTAYFSARDQLIILSTPGIARAEFLRSTHISLDPLRPAVTLIARQLDPANPAARLPFIGTVLSSQSLTSTQLITVWASEAAADLHGLIVGKQFMLPLGEHSQPVVVGGIWRDYARQHGALVINLADYRRLTGDERVTEVGMWLQAGTIPAQAANNLRASLPNNNRLDIAEPGEVRRLSLKIFDRSFTVTYLLEAVAIIVGLFGIAASFGGQALARAREFGMLRHIGVTRRQIGMMLAIEGALLTTLGVLAGLLLGWVIALILIHVVNPQSFHWTMNTHMPWALLSGVAATLIFAAAITAWLSGRSAMSMQAIRAVRDDW